MRTMILADGSFARREQPMLARLETGLAAEGVRTVRAVPDGCLTGVVSGVHTPVVGYEESAGPLGRRARARRLAAGAAAALDAGAGDGPWLDVVHCLGYGACELGMQVARLSGAAVAVEVWCGDVVRRARELSVARAGREGEPPVVLMAPDGAVAEALGGTGASADGQGQPTGPVELTPWGVHVPAHVRPPIDPDGPVSVAVLADGADIRAIYALLDALAELASRHPNLLVFFDADSAERLGGGRAVWRRAKQLGILDRLSMVGAMEGHREPVLHVDMLLQPEAVGAHHSLTLEAMAAGVAVVARADPLVESLVDGQTAVVVESPSAGAWAEAIGRVLGDAAFAQRLRESAREYVRTSRSAIAHVEAVLRGYERVAGMRTGAA